MSFLKRFIVKRLGLSLGPGLRLETGNSRWELGMGNWDGKLEWENGNGKMEMGMGNREYPYPQSQEMTV